MDLQFWIGFWIIWGSWIPAIFAILSDLDGDRLRRERKAILRGPSLCIEGKPLIQEFPEIQKLERSARPVRSAGALYAEVCEWCDKFLKSPPRYYRDNRRPYAVFRYPDDAFQFKLRWL
jgi:hypothetical protein